MCVFPMAVLVVFPPFYRWGNRGLERFSKSEPGLWLPARRSGWRGRMRSQRSGG